jgi:hypothetical protein
MDTLKIDKRVALIDEFAEQRAQLKVMVLELEKLKEGIERIFPERLDARYSRFFEEKVKTVTELFKAILDIKKEISKTIKDELDLRNKYENGEEGEDDYLGDIDIRTLAKRLEQLNNNSNKMIMGNKPEIILEKSEIEKLEEVVNG